MTNEECWVLLGRKIGPFWVGRVGWRTVDVQSSPTHIEFWWIECQRREEERGDVIGWLHTHPNMIAFPSERDVRTMFAWASSFGKPLLCLIEGRNGLRGYVLCPDETWNEVFVIRLTRSRFVAARWLHVVYKRCRYLFKKGGDHGRAGSRTIVPRGGTA